MTDTGLFKPRWVRCPACGQKALYAAENAARPFCSPRCRGTDLGAWASENYRVAAEPPTDTDESAQPPGPAH
jgi:endogenous inhibitor of DNA gyrase (YacG/DUF329 family)